MGKFLLDTHTLLWYDNDPGQFSGAVRKALRSKSATIFVSPASIYEIAFKARIRPMVGAVELVDNLDHRLIDYDLRVLPITHRHMKKAAQLDWPNRDPFDRIIAAQAIIEGMIVVTKDDAFASASDVKILW